MKLSDIRRTFLAASKGPYGWFGNVDHEDPYLARPGRIGRTTVLGTVRHELTEQDARAAGVHEQEFAITVMLDGVELFPHHPLYDELYDEEHQSQVRAAIAEWLDDGYGGRRTENRLCFATPDQPGPSMLVEARGLAVFEVAPHATSRDDPRVYRADVAGLRHPDAAFLAGSWAMVDSLLRMVDELAETVRDGLDLSHAVTDSAWRDRAAGALALLREQGRSPGGVTSR